MSRTITAGLVLSLALFATGCHDSSQETSVLHESGAPLKPVVTVVPVIDSTKHDLSWNLSDELTNAIDYRLETNDNVYLVEPAKTRASIRKLKETYNPFAMDTSWVKKTFNNEEFVVFLELIDHEEVLRQDKKNLADPQHCSADLNMSMRVRVFDLRGDQPHVILQELVRHTHFVPRQFTQVNFYQASWGEESFSISPIGLAHAEFIEEIAERIEDYILLASNS
jgi:hypothetical protein